MQARQPVVLSVSLTVIWTQEQNTEYEQINGLPQLIVNEK